MKQYINHILSVLFPYQDPHGSKVSVFMQETWLDKIMHPTQVKDYLWVPSAANQR